MHAVSGTALKTVGFSNEVAQTLKNKTFISLKDLKDQFPQFASDIEQKKAHLLF